MADSVLTVMPKPRAKVVSGTPGTGAKSRNGYQSRIRYDASRKITAAQFIDLLRRSTLAERRPIDDPKCIAAMLRHANLLCTAWDRDTLVGVARSVTDFEFCCYLSDLAVDRSYQKCGIGRKLIALTQSKLGRRAKINLLAAPQAEGYYPRIGFDAHPSAWIISATKSLS
jgi:GNAT superfamily N-acetyltransferase